jgi:NADH-quinone oxidoreductase subunit G
VPAGGGLKAQEMFAPGALDVLFLLGADEIDMPPHGTFVVYLGTHGDVGAHRADVILPGAAYTEKSGIWVNTEGRVQIGLRAAFPPGDARDDWSIIRALSGVIGRQLPFDSLSQLRTQLYQAHPHMAALDQVQPATLVDISRLASRGGDFSGGPFFSPLKDFYMTNPIARASRVMAECAALHAGTAAQAAE